MIVYFNFIPGFMVGFEWQYEHGAIVLDVGIFRLVVVYNPEEE